MPKHTCPSCRSMTKPCDITTTRTFATEYRCSDCNAVIQRSGLGTLIILMGTLLNFALVLFSDQYLRGQPLTLISLILLAAALIGLGFVWMRPKVKTPAMQPIRISDRQQH